MLWEVRGRFAEPVVIGDGKCLRFGWLYRANSRPRSKHSRMYAESKQRESEVLPPTLQDHTLRPLSTRLDVPIMTGGWVCQRLSNHGAGSRVSAIIGKFGPF